MKMLKKLLAVVLTGAMALTLLTACGGNAVRDKDIADAMNEMTKAKNSAVTFTPQTAEREMARKIAVLAENEMANAAAESDGNAYNEQVKKILGVKEGGVNAKRFVWAVTVETDGLGVSGQAAQLFEILFGDDGLVEDFNEDRESLKDKTPADTRYMGSALCKGVDMTGNPVTVRIIVVTADAKAEEDKD